MAELHPTGGYEHVTIVEPGRIAFLSRQCPVDANENVVGIGVDLTARLLERGDRSRR